MAAKPILFNTGMVRALLEGRKTVTRRVVKPQPPGNFPYCHLEGDNLWYWTTRDGDDDMMDWWPSYERGVKPLYQPGDILYVRETWTTLVGSYIYKVDQKPGMQNPGKWRPSIHMPKEAARIFLRVTGVRVERLLDPFFTNKAAIFVLQNEGIDIGEHCRQCINHYGSPCCIDHEEDDECGILDDIRGDFSERWDAAIKPADRALYGWAANPWVWVIEFERISKEEALRNWRMGNDSGKD